MRVRFRIGQCHWWVVVVLRGLRSGAWCAQATLQAEFELQAEFAREFAPGIRTTASRSDL